MSKTTNLFQKDTNMILREFEKICEGINALKRKSIVDSIPKLPTNYGNIYYNRIREEIIDAEYREDDSNMCIDIDKIISEWARLIKIKNPKMFERCFKCYQKQGLDIK